MRCVLCVCDCVVCGVCVTEGMWCVSEVCVSVCGVCTIVRVCECVSRVYVCRACVECPRLGVSTHSDSRPVPSVLQAKAAKSEREARRLQLRSLQYLERYVCLVLFNAYLHLEKAGSWQRPFSAWMREVRAGVGAGTTLCVFPGPRDRRAELSGQSSHLTVQDASLWLRLCLVQLWVPSTASALSRQ